MTVNYEIGRPRADKRMRITLLLCIGKTKKRIKTDLSVSLSDLNRKGKIRNDSPIYKNVREKIQKVETEYSNLDTFLTGESLSASEALDRMTNTDIPTFFEYADRWVERATIKGLRNYKTALKRFREYTKHDILFSQFSHILLSGFIIFLKGRPTAQCSYTNAIKKIYSDAEKDYDIKPFSSFRLDIPPAPKTRHRALDIETIRRIFAWDGTDRKAVIARDSSVLSFCLCGTNSADLYHAPVINGNIFAYERVKTKDRRTDDAYMEIEIPEYIKDLVKKYKDSKNAFSFHRMYYNEGKYNSVINKGLKAICRDLGIDGITFYAFRHSWATIARNTLGIEKSTVHDALCHIERDTAIDDIYIKKDFTLINDANKKVVDYVLGNL